MLSRFFPFVSYCHTSSCHIVVVVSKLWYVQNHIFWHFNKFLVNIAKWVSHIKEHSNMPLCRPFWEGWILEKCWFWKTGNLQVDIARFAMDIEHFEITLAILKILAYTKVCILRVLMRFILQDSQLSKSIRVVNLDTVSYTHLTLPTKRIV